jgi:hypothetical protein
LSKDEVAAFAAWMFARHAFASKLIVERRASFCFHLMQVRKKITTIDRPDVVAKLLRDMC